MTKKLNDVLLEMFRGKFGEPIDRDWKLRHDSINDEGGLKSLAPGEKYQHDADQGNTFKYDTTKAFHDVHPDDAWKTFGMGMNKHSDGRYYTLNAYDRKRAVEKGFKLSDNQKD